MRLCLLMLAALCAMTAAQSARADDGGVTDPDHRVVDFDDRRAVLREASSLMYERRYHRALELGKRALEMADAAHDESTAENARELCKHLLEVMPHVTFERPPKEVTDLEVKFDDRSVPIEALEKKYSVDPGTHTVHAGGTRNGQPVTFDKDVEAEDSVLTTIALPLAAFQPDPLAQLHEETQLCAMYVDPSRCDDFSRCLENAKSLDEQRACAAARNIQRTRACGACEISSGERMPPGLLVFPLAAIVRRVARRRRGRASSASASPAGTTNRQ